MGTLRQHVDQLAARMGGDADEGDDLAFPGLHWMTAGLFLAAGAEAALGRRRGERDAVRWAPALVAPLAGAAHVARALWPGRTTRVTAQIANGLATTTGALGLVNSMHGALQERTAGSFLRRRSSLRQVPSFAPLAFGAAGILGTILDDQERQEADEHRRLQRRARLMDRILPRRRRPSRIVIKV